MEKGPETLFIADLPGPEAVAFGAGLAGWADLVPAFDNWPHPAGVVPSHETLAAMLYYANYVQEQKRRSQSPPRPSSCWIRGACRPILTGSDQFDNRYLANVPLADALKERGIRNVLYVVPDRSQKQERDDLNDEFVEYKSKQIGVSVFPLSDVQRVQEKVAEKTAGRHDANRGASQLLLRRRLWIAHGIFDDVCVFGAASHGLLPLPLWRRAAHDHEQYAQQRARAELHAESAPDAV